MRRSRLLGVVVAVALGSVIAPAPASTRTAASPRGPWPLRHVVVGYRTPAALASLLDRFPATLVRRLPHLRTAELRPGTDPGKYAQSAVRVPGIQFAQPLALRRHAVEPAVYGGTTGAAAEWEFAAAGEAAVPDSILRAASGITIAVVDTGADLNAPDLASKTPGAYDVRSGTVDVRDLNGHGTFVASLAAGSVSNNEGISGFGGDAQLLVVRAATRDGVFSDADEAAGIVYAVDHGARIINLSLGGPTTSATERRAIDYAVEHGVLLVAAAGNERQLGNPVEYPAALLQPLGSNGIGGTGLVVAASAPDGNAAEFSNSGSYVSLAAPGVDVLGAVSVLSSPEKYPRAALRGAHGGLYGVASGTSFSAPEVAGAAALVWATNPGLRAQDVAQILKETASGLGSWTSELGFGVIDVAAAVARANGQPTVLASASLQRERAHLSWSGPADATYVVSASRDGEPERVVLTGAQTDAWFHVPAGHTYSFTVSAVDATGATTAVSSAVSVRVERLAAAVSTRARRSRLQH